MLSDGSAGWPIPVTREHVKHWGLLHVGMDMLACFGCANALLYGEASHSERGQTSLQRTVRSTTVWTVFKIIASLKRLKHWLPLSNGFTN